MDLRKAVRLPYTVRKVADALVLLPRRRFSYMPFPARSGRLHNSEKCHMPGDTIRWLETSSRAQQGHGLDRDAPKQDEDSALWTLYMRAGFGPDRRSQTEAGLSARARAYISHPS